MKRIALTFALVLTLFICLYLAIFHAGLGMAVLDLMVDIQRGTITSSTIRIINVIAVSAMMILFGGLGWRLAKKKRRNRFLWTALCVIFNLWAFIALCLLSAKPGSDEQGGRSGNAGKTAMNGGNSLVPPPTDGIASLTNSRGKTDALQ